MWDNLFKPMDIIQKGLSASWTRNAVIRNNIANVETPGFKASDVEFETILAKSIYDGGNGFKGTKTHPKHIDIGVSSKMPNYEKRIIKRNGLSMRADGNDVDIESENTKLVQNSLYYYTLMEKMNSEIRRLRAAISEGR
jgi:flagellar basal-body rod protein FlgB